MLQEFLYERNIALLKIQICSFSHDIPLSSSAACWQWFWHYADRGHHDRRHLMFPLEFENQFIDLA